MTTAPDPDRPPFLVGPTAVGKTAVAVQIARRCGLEILSVDSRQVYRRLDLITAMPTPAERAAARHHLIDLLEPAASISAAEFARRFREARREVRGRGRDALAVGGSGLYVDACLGRLDRLPAADAALRASYREILRAEGLARLHEMLRAVDGETAARLAPGDAQRIIRALEVAALTGVPLSRLHTRGGRLDLGTGPPMVLLVRERGDLRDRIARRAAAMLEAGVLEELRSVLAAGVPDDAPGLQAIGCADFLRALRGEIGAADAVDAFVRRTARYAKRQMTWFRNRYAGVRMLPVPADESPGATAERVLESLRGPLTGPPAGP
jgi:tRNA dimethylallyltransferase